MNWKENSVTTLRVMSDTCDTLYLSKSLYSPPKSPVVTLSQLGQRDYQSHSLHV